MISLILPYWNRKEAADRAFESLRQYEGLDLEIVLVDDGSAEPYVAPPSALNVVYLRLPLHHEPRSPIAAWNAGVAASTGDMVCLSCVEVIHEVPVLAEMALECERLGPMGYTLASAWCPELDEWHCHTTKNVPTCPKGTGIAFCGMMHRSLWEKVNGFDLEYMGGAGFEDRDLIQRLHKAGALFLIRDDLRVIHPKTGAQIHWGADRFAINEALYFKKWPLEVTVCCVNVGNYLGRGQEYVDKLRDMVMRNTSLPFKFEVFTEENLPVQGLKGWDAKLALFHPNAFRKGERVVFFDLDTLIIGDIDPLLKYRGDFATLRDFWRPEGLGPAVIMWEAGKYDWLWNEYELQGRPPLTRGDQEWIEDTFVRADIVILQDLFHDMFCSYKTHCHPYPPKDCAVVCFHGLPRPHECTQQWVQDAWKVGGSSRLSMHLAVNTGTQRLLANVLANGSSAPWICSCPAHSGEALIVGSGPSLLDTIPDIREAATRGGVIFALNGAAKILQSYGIKVSYHIVLDARPDNIQFLGHAEVYLLASQCDPSLFAEVKGHILQWHPVMDGIDALFPEAPMTLIGGGTTVGISGMALVYTMGYRKIHLFGYDSSFREYPKTASYAGREEVDKYKQHAAPQKKTIQESMVFEVGAFDKRFWTNAAMARQAEIFPQFAQQLLALGVEIYVHGDGLLPHIAQSLAATAESNYLEKDYACI